MLSFIEILWVILIVGAISFLCIFSRKLIRKKFYDKKSR